MREERHEGWIWEYADKGISYEREERKREKGVILREEIYPCSFCKGTGLGWTGGKCPVCHGKETVNVKPPVVICAFCKGKGTDQPMSQVTCPACRGKGVIRVKEPIEKCGSCRGRGRPLGSNLYCLTCKGAGVVSIKGSTAKGGTPTVRRPSGSELEVMEVLHEEGKAGRHGIGGKIRVSVSYANYLCKSLLDKGLITRVDRDFFALTPAGETIFEKRTRKKGKKEEEKSKIEPVPAQKYEEHKGDRNRENYGMWRIEK